MRGSYVQTVIYECSTCTYQAIKTVEKATMKKMKEAEIKAQITKARKLYWFEKVSVGDAVIYMK